MTKAGSPQHLRDKWSSFKIDFEDRLEVRCRSWTFRAFSLLTLALIQCILSFAVVARQPSLNFAYVSIFQIFFWALCVWGAGGLILPLARRFRGPAIAGLLAVHILAVVFWFGREEPWPGLAMQILVMILQPVLAYFLCSLSEKWPPWTAWITSLSIAAFSYAVFYICQDISKIEWVSLRANPSRYLMFVTFFALQFHFLRARFKNVGEKLAYVFNPTQTLVPLPLPFGGVADVSTSRTSAQGLLNLIFATTAMVFFLALAQAGTPAAKIQFVLVGCAYQFFALFYLAAFSVGLMQWCGYALPHPCDFALISATPHMRWRRWNRYTYKWLSLAVFFPVLKKTGNRLVSLLACFSIVAFLHMNASLFIPGVYPPGSDIARHLLSLLTYYLGHGLAIWLGFFVPSSWSDERKISSWAGVILTWTLTACIFSLYY